jgi:hypothetical protein
MTLNCRSVHQYLAIEAVAGSSLFSSSSSMQRSTKTRPIWISVFSSASLKRVFWNLAISWPKALRSLVYWMVQSSAASAAAIEITAICRRSQGSSCIR